MVDLERVTRELERRHEALPLEIAVHFVLQILRAAGQRELELADVIVDRQGCIHLQPGRVCSPEETVRSIGMILYVLLVGHRAEDPPPLHRLGEEMIPESLIRIVARALAPYMTTCYRTGEEFHQDLARWSSLHQRRVSSSLVAQFFRHHALFPQRQKRSSRLRWLWAAALGATAGGLISTLLMLGH